MKKDIEKEFEEYKKFIDDKMSSNKIDFNNENVKLLLGKSIVLIHLTDCISETSGMVQFKHYFMQVEEAVLKFILFFPMQERIALSTYLRVSIESILKLMLSVSKQENGFENTGYSVLKEELKTMEIYHEEKDLLDNLFEKFSNMSKTLHAKGGSVDIISSLNKFLYTDLEKDVLVEYIKCIDFIIEGMIYLLSIHHNDLSTSQMLRLERLISKKKLRHIKRNSNILSESIS
ncbi:hypothetical protein HB943_06620 [Listeria weihenstephanensis]|uniref:Uncharacterized protein n=1 Tax=Listeria weihenstephanensis TaxID=1006155 RepID=A0A841Z334_9LIST|nr:hypothetical protein [Listeria weihenstephanensis]MBC1500271.1 hypothetical protein [Listeria weihenstephanensis]